MQRAIMLVGLDRSGRPCLKASTKGGCRSASPLCSWAGVGVGADGTDGIRLRCCRNTQADQLATPGRPDMSHFIMARPSKVLTAPGLKRRETRHCRDCCWRRAIAARSLACLAGAASRCARTAGSGIRRSWIRPSAQRASRWPYTQLPGLYRPGHKSRHTLIPRGQRLLVETPRWRPHDGCRRCAGHRHQRAIACGLAGERPRWPDGDCGGPARGKRAWRWPAFITGCSGERRGTPQPLGSALSMADASR